MGEERETGGEDWADLGLGVYWRDGYNEVVGELENAKKRAQRYKVDCAGLELGGCDCAVFRKGATTGGGKGLQRMARR